MTPRGSGRVSSARVAGDPRGQARHTVPLQRQGDWLGDDLDGERHTRVHQH